MPLSPNTLTFLEKLSKNNTKEWFESNRKMYEAAKQDFLQLTQNALIQVSKWDETIAHLEPKNCVFRINRDVRFSKNKDPYKNNMGMSIAKGGKKINTAGYYFHLQPNACFIGGGFYMPMGDDLHKIRQEIDYNFSDFNKIIKAKSFASIYKQLEATKEYKLSRPPKGYDESNPAIEFLKLTCFVATVPLSNEVVLDKNIEKTISTHFKALHPLISFINNALDN
jgi:uncharacterized protein (TIGR02453 family)